MMVSLRIEARSFVPITISRRPIPSAWREALHAAEKLDPEGGGGFNPRITPIKSTGAFRPGGGRFPLIALNS
jgi:hypothetical protein